MKKFGLLTAAFLMMGLLFGTQVMAQHIELGAAKSAQNCAQVTDNGFTASFSFSSIDATEVSTEKGVFSTITMDGTYPSGNVGEPMLPAANKLIAVPFGAKDLTVTVKSYSTSTYRLADYGINKVTPMQPMLRKDQKPEDVPFAYSEKAYAVKGFASRPIAEVKIQGTMRGIQIGALTVNPVQYDAASNSILVYNDIEVEVSYGQYDKSAAYNEFARTFSPYFANIYGMMFNWRDDVYDEHPDLWQNPVHMLIIADRMFEECLQPWYEWKTTKGFYLNINYTDEIGTSAAAIRAFIQDEYSKDAPTFLMIMGDKNQVAASATGSETHCVTDLQYSSVDGDQFPDMYHSRFPAENVTQMMAMVEKALEYEQYTMPDPSYLNNVLLIAGEDSGWGVTVGRPTIWYATNYYYNTDHGFTEVNEFSHGTYTNCYSYLSTGVGFANYTAHGSQTSWAGPTFNVNDVNTLTNEHKYFLAMGNCCQAADWGYSSTCFGEAMVRAENKGAFAYIGSCPSTYWKNDYYFGVGATNRADGTMPSYEETTMGFYDAWWTDEAYNCVTSLMFIGNLASNAAEELGYEIHISNLYDWQAYHTLGDGSILPFRVQPTENSVSHMPTLPIGMETYTVSAAPGSYVGISKDGVLYGAGMIDETGTTDIAIEPITSGGDVKIVVTHPQFQPYVAIVPAAAMNGAYIAVDAYALNAPQADYGETLDMEITLKNVGTEAANNLTATLSTENEYVEILANEGSVANLDPDNTATIEGFQFSVAENVPDKTKAQFELVVTDGTESWTSKINIVLHAPVLAIESIEKDEEKVFFTFTNEGTAPFYGGTLNIFSSSSAVTFAETTIAFEDVVEGGSSITIEAAYTVDPTVEEGSTFEIGYTLTSGLLSVEGNFILTYGAIMEGFESGAFGDDWTFSADYPWTIVPNGHDGSTYSAMSGNKNIASSTSYMQLTVNVPAAGDLTFYYKVSSESNWDKCYFYMDGQEKAVWSGTIDWTMYTQPVTTGTHTFKWSYTKDSSVNSGEDCVWIDDIHFPPVHVYNFLEPVTNLVAEVNDRDVTISWESSDQASSFIIMRDGVEIERVTENTYTEHVPYGNYEYAVVATDDEGNLSTPTIILVEVLDVYDVEENTMSLRVYPNPVSNTLYISSNADFTYSMYNNMGQEVVKGNAQGSQRINVNELPKGIYFLRITSGGQTNVQKIIVK